MEPWFDEQETKALADYMRAGGWVTEFRKTRQFEEEIAEFAGARYCSVVNNGTISLTLALIACGVGAGDEVIVPAYTMVATANAVKLTGAEVVFADVSPDSLCMDLDGVQRALTDRTRAVILVTLNGRYPADYDQWSRFCAENGLRFIEDAAQSLGSRKSGRQLGTFGELGSFSFSAPKVITTGQGGALITDDERLIDRVHRLRDFGRAGGGADHYETMGWNFKFTDIQAVLGIEQMKKLPWRVERKKEIYRQYAEQLEGVGGIALIPTDLADTSPWFVDVLVQDGRREQLAEHLKSHQIGSRPFYPVLPACPVYRRNQACPVAEQAAREGLWLPSASKLTDEQVTRICRHVRGFFEQSQPERRIAAA